MADTVRIEELRRRVQMDPASIAFAELAEEYRRARRFDDAIATCRTGLQRHPAYLSARVTLGRSLLETGRFDEARQELEHVLRIAPENLAAIRALAEIHHRAGELPETDHQFALPESEAVAAGPVAEAPQATVASPPVLPPLTPQPAPPPQAAPPPAPAPVSRQVAAPPQVAAPMPQVAAPMAHVAAPVPPPVPVAPKVAAPMPPQVVAPLAQVAARPVLPAPRPPHPDEVALPALEVFLSAIVAARTSGNRVSN